MVEKALSERVIAASMAFLSQIDALGMNPLGAMWVRDHLLEDWRFCLVTSLIDTIGPAKVIDLLLDLRDKSGFPEGFDIMDVYLSEPCDPLARALSIDGKAGPDGLARFQNQEVDGRVYDAVILRPLHAEPSAQESRAIGRRFAKNIKSLRQAAE